jgi:hypothetical protein
MTKEEIDKIEKVLGKRLHESTAQEVVDAFGRERATSILISFSRTYWPSLKRGRRAVVEASLNCQPPRLAEGLLHFLLPKQQRDALIGDLEEEMRTRIVPKFGHGWGQLWYWMQGLGALWHAYKFRVVALLAGVPLFGKAAEVIRRLSGQ